MVIIIFRLYIICRGYYSYDLIVLYRMTLHWVTQEINDQMDNDNRYVTR